MSIAAKVLADSIPHAGMYAGGKRITTLEVTMPRPFLAEFNTHRILSRNSASSRAIPPEKQIARIRDGDFYVPVFGSRVKGMGQGDDLTDDQQETLQSLWRLEALDAARTVERLLEHGSDKSHANRLLEPFIWHTIIVTATDWRNFMALRDHKDAAPEIQETARAMKTAMAEHTPQIIGPGGWHLPLVSADELNQHAGLGDDKVNFWPLVSAGRCARVSFDTHANYETPLASFERATSLSERGHWSPMEHPAMFTLMQGRGADWGNFDGPWLQLRKMYADEAVFKG